MLGLKLNPSWFGEKPFTMLREFLAETAQANVTSASHFTSS